MPRLPRVSGKELARALLRAGFVLDRVKGSHHVLIHAATGREVVVPYPPRVCPVGTTAHIIREAGLTVEEFIDLLH